MPDMLARLYDASDPAPFIERVAGAGYKVRRMEPWDRDRLREFNLANFGELWAVEADRAFLLTPITGYVATKDGQIVGFGVWECTRRGFFGPTGVQEDLRGTGLGAAILLSCLRSMYESGYGYAIIGGVGPAQFYEKTVGAFVIPGSEVGIYEALNEIRGEPI